VLGLLPVATFGGGLVSRGQKRLWSADCTAAPGWPTSAFSRGHRQPPFFLFCSARGGVAFLCQRGNQRIKAKKALSRPFGVAARHCLIAGKLDHGRGERSVGLFGPVSRAPWAGFYN